MSIIKIAVRNYKKHKNLTIEPNGQSFFLVGDSEEGKTSILSLIQAFYMRDKFPVNALTEGEEEGEVMMVADGDGLKYTISRKFNRAGVADRFTIVDENGGKHSSLSDVLEKVLGPAFMNKYFDYDRYFNKTKSPQARFEYVVEALGGTEIIENTEKREKLIEERKTIGRQKDQQQKFYHENGGSMDEEELERQYKYFQKERKLEEAIAAKESFLTQNLIDPEEIQLQKEIVDSIIERKEYLNTEIPIKQSRINEIDILLKQLKAEKALAAKFIKEGEVQLRQLDPKAEEKSADYQQQLTEAENKNDLLRKQAEDAYLDNLNTIQEFNIQRKSFIDNCKALKELQRLTQEWEDMTTQIKELKDKNAEIFKQNLPLPELSVGTDSKGKDIILYNGREFSLDNISTGQSIQITAQIQRALNPNHTSFIVIPNAQDLGSKIDGIMESCKEFGIQAIVEVTKRDQKFKVVITDDAKSV